MRRLRRFLRLESAGRELADEMREHLREKIEDLVDSGMARADAEAEARRRFGNMPSLGERSRDEWGFAFAERLAQDMRYALRSVRMNPLFAAVVVLPLALGIGANTVIFTVVHAALIRPLPYYQPDRLVHLWEANPKREPGPYGASYQDLQDWRGAGRYFEGFAAYVDGSTTLSQMQQPERVTAGWVTTDFFPLLGVKPAMGRSFVAGEDQPGAPGVMLLSHAIWQRAFHGDPSIVGRSVAVGSNQVAVVGVLPAGFHFASVGDADLWFPLVAGKNQRANRFQHWMGVIARLLPGASLEQATAEMRQIAERIARDDPAYHTGSSILIKPLRDVFVGNVRPALLALLGAIGMVLLLACANVANLLLARAAVRRKELALRGSLGASRGRLVQQLLTENLLLALAGGALGVAFAHWGLRVMVAALPADMRSHMPFLEGIGIHWGMLAFTAAVSLAMGMLFGMAPALRLSKTDLHATLESGHRSTGGREHLRLRHALLVAEVAISLVLLTGAGLMMRSTAKLLAVNPGFNPQGLLTLNVSLPFKTYNTQAKVGAFHDRLMERIEALPGVVGTGTVSVLPLTGGLATGGFQVVGRTDPSEKFGFSIRDISSGYLHAIGVPLIAGRNFDNRDAADGPRVVMINRKLARAAFPHEDPVGKRVVFPWIKGQVEIVGVAGDENTGSLDAEVQPVVYFPYSQGLGGGWSTVVRTAGPATGLIAAVRNEVRVLDPEVVVFRVRTMEQVITDAPYTVVRRYPAMLMGAFAAIALLMAVIGTYGLVAYGVSQRLHEIGVRVALGARPADILRLVMGRSLALALAGIAVGVGSAAVLTRGLQKLLFGVKPLDPATFAVVAAVLVGAVLAASFIPARRATQVPPGVATCGE
jgi:predicted permease